MEPSIDKMHTTPTVARRLDGFSSKSQRGPRPFSESVASQSLHCILWKLVAIASCLALSQLCTFIAKYVAPKKETGHLHMTPITFTE